MLIFIFGVVVSEISGIFAQSLNNVATFIVDYQVVAISYLDLV